MLAWELRPAAIEADGLVGSLRRFGREWSTNYGIAFEFNGSSPPAGLSPDTENNLYRITQEALNNVIKHAGATCVGATLNYTDDHITLTIEDDGKGFDPAEERVHDGYGGFGLVGMRERAEHIGGTMEIESEPGHGTTILVRVPLEEANEAPLAAAAGSET
jgi:signal transduction histidine kinase